MAGIEFLKGHGTQNDFVVLPDPECRLDLTPARVAALCDRPRGLGADGVLRVIPADGGGWFMDYRNADGSLAEMCGNGVRVFARYLLDSGLQQHPEFTVGSRAGGRRVVVHPDGDVTVHMGPAEVVGKSTADIGGERFDGIAVDVGNPHLVSITDRPVDGLDLERQPRYDAGFFPHGVNLEFANQVGEGLLRMRVHERGVGETRACGTGTVATVAAALHLSGAESGEAAVDVPGGRVRVTVSPGASTLTGPAEFVARGTLQQSWWDAIG